MLLLKAKIGWGPHVNKLITFLLEIPAQLLTEVKPQVHWLARFLNWKMACLEILMTEQLILVCCSI